MACCLFKASVHSIDDDETKPWVSRTPSSSRTPSFLRPFDADGDDDDLSCPSIKLFPESTDEDGLRYLSFESLTEAIDSLKDDIAGKPDLSSLVNDYFKNSADLLRFFIALCDRLRTARKSKTIGLDALDSKVVEELLSELSRLHDALVAKKDKLVEKLQLATKWRKVSFAVHKILCAVGIILSALLGLLGGPAAAITAATVATTACLSIGPWLKSRWDKCKIGHEEQRDAVEMMERSARSSVRMLCTVHGLVKQVDVAAASLLGATRDLKEKTAAAAAAAEDEMENKVGSS